MVQAFYDDLSENDHLIFPDWAASVRRQGAVLDRLIRVEVGDRPLQILDTARGIGTQAIGWPWPATGSTPPTPIRPPSSAPGGRTAAATVPSNASSAKRPTAGGPTSG